jgi:hypothetical protein
MSAGPKFVNGTMVLLQVDLGDYISPDWQEVGHQQEHTIEHGWDGTDEVTLRCLLDLEDETQLFLRDAYARKREVELRSVGCEEDYTIRCHLTKVKWVFPDNDAALLLITAQGQEIAEG